MIHREFLSNRPCQAKLHLFVSPKSQFRAEGCGFHNNLRAVGAHDRNAGVSAPPVLLRWPYVALEGPKPVWPDMLGLTSAAADLI